MNPLPFLCRQFKVQRGDWCSVHLSGLLPFQFDIEALPYFDKSNFHSPRDSQLCVNQVWFGCFYGKFSIEGYSHFQFPYFYLKSSSSLDVTTHLLVLEADKSTNFQEQIGFYPCRTKFFVESKFSF